MNKILSSAVILTAIFGISKSALALAGAAACVADINQRTLADVQKMTVMDSEKVSFIPGSVNGQLQISQETGQVTILMQYGFTKDCELARVYNVQLDQQGQCQVGAQVGADLQDCD